MRNLCRLTAIALALSSLYFLLSGYDALSLRAYELDGSYDRPITVFTILNWEFGEHASPLFAGLAHGLLAIVVWWLPDRLNTPLERLPTLGIQGDPLE